MIICCGEALIDMVWTQVPGPGKGFIPLPGGSPYNTAVAIGRLGVPVKFLGRFSTDFFGEILVKRLRDNLVGDDLIIRSAQNSTLAFVKLDKGKEPQYVFYTEGTAGSSLQVSDLPPKLPAETRCILFGSISMTVEPIASAIEALILREGTRKSADQMDGAPVISFDPNIRPFMIKDRDAYITKFEKWVSASTIAKISAADFEFLYPKLGQEQALQKILAMGPRVAICTQGPKGALALLRRNNGSVLRVSAPVVNLPVVDTIGAGDAFHGAFLSWLEIKGKMSRSALVNMSETDLYDALFFANKAASIVCSRRGAEPPSRREAERLKAPPPESGPQAKAGAVKKAAAKNPAKESPAAEPKTAGKAPAEKPEAKPKAAAKAPAKKAADKEAAVKSKAAAKKPAVKEAAVRPAVKPKAGAAQKDDKKK